MSELRPRISDVHSELSDKHTEQWGDTAVITSSLEQDYTFDGQRLHIAAPTTVGLRRQDGDWKLALLHSVALPPEG